MKEAFQNIVGSVGIGVITLVVTAAVGGELRAPVPGELGEPGEPGWRDAVGGEDRLAFGELEKESLKLGLCRPERLAFPDSTSFSSESFTWEKRESNQNTSSNVSSILQTNSGS